MKEKKQDLRTIKTKQNIKNTFIQMVEEIGYQKVSIKNLCDRAMINRNTFYQYYEHKDDLVKSLVKETIDDIKAKIIPLGSNFFLHINTSNQVAFTNDIKKLVEIIQSNIELLRIVLSDETLAGYYKGLEYSIEKIVISYLNIHDTRSFIAFKYVLNGFNGVIVDWIIKDTASITETSEILSNLIFDNVRFFLKIKNN